MHSCPVAPQLHQEWDGEGCVYLKCPQCGVEGPPITLAIERAEPVEFHRTWLGGAAIRNLDATEQAERAWKEFVDPDYHLPAIHCRCEDCKEKLRAIGNTANWLYN